MQERENNTTTESPRCQCEAQITAILLRLDKLESEALTESKLADLFRSNIAETIAKSIQ